MHKGVTSIPQAPCVHVCMSVYAKPQPCCGSQAYHSRELFKEVIVVFQKVIFLNHACQSKLYIFILFPSFSLSWKLAGTQSHKKTLRRE